MLRRRCRGDDVIALLPSSVMGRLLSHSPIILSSILESWHCLLVEYDWQLMVLLFDAVVDSFRGIVWSREIIL